HDVPDADQQRQPDDDERQIIREPPPHPRAVSTAAASRCTPCSGVTLSLCTYSVRTSIIAAVIGLVCAMLWARLSSTRLLLKDSIRTAEASRWPSVHAGPERSTSVRTGIEPV